jgi:hypothetical protein
MATQRSSFTALEVEGMPDDELLQNFARITGKKCLSCKHCHSEKVELTAFVIVLRKWCLKKMNKGMHAEMSIPKTCDHQSLANKKRQPIYTQIKNAPTEEIVAEIKAENKDILKVPVRRKRIVRTPAIQISDGETTWTGVVEYIKTKKITHAIYKKQLKEGVIVIVSEPADEPNVSVEPVVIVEPVVEPAVEPVVPVEPAVESNVSVEPVVEPNVSVEPVVVPAVSVPVVNVVIVNNVVNVVHIIEKNSPNTKVLVTDEKESKKGNKGHLCWCGCNTFQTKMLKTTCCGARYVNAEHQTKDWKRHKCICHKYRCHNYRSDDKYRSHDKYRSDDKYRDKLHPFYLPINRQEELAMILCPMSCEGCDFCDYQPRFAMIENVD